MLEHLKKWLSFLFFSYWTFLVKEIYYHFIQSYVILQKFKPWQVTDCFKSSHLRNSKLLDVVKTNGYLSNNVNFFYVIKDALNLNFLHLVPLIYISETFKLLDVVSGGKKESACLWRGEEAGVTSPYAGATDRGGHDTLSATKRQAWSYICFALLT